jgi:hypothetical protein
MIQIDISPGELIDRGTILEIKVRRVGDGPARAQLDTLRAALAAVLTASPEISVLTRELMTINERLWDAENLIRKLDRDGSFDGDFVQTARRICVDNDRRSAVKQRINELTLGAPGETKIYELD